MKRKRLLWIISSIIIVLSSIHCIGQETDPVSVLAGRIRKDSNLKYVNTDTLDLSGYGKSLFGLHRGKVCQENFLVNGSDEFASLIQVPNGLMLFAPQTTNNKITGEKEVSPHRIGRLRYYVQTDADTVLYVRNDQYAFQKTGMNPYIMSINLRNTDKYFGPDCQDGVSESDYLKQMLSAYNPEDANVKNNITFIISGCKSWEPYMQPDGYYGTKCFYDASKNRGYIIDERPVIETTDKIYDGYDYSYPTMLFQRQYLNAERTDYVDFMIDDVIKEVKTAGNVVEITFNHNDYIKYSLYSHGIFEGRVNRGMGIFEIKSDNPSRKTFAGKYTFLNNVPARIEFSFSRIDSNIPAGFYFECEKFPIDWLTAPDPTGLIIKGSRVRRDADLYGYICDNTGNSIYNISMNTIYGRDASEEGVRAKSNLKKQYDSKYIPVYNSLCSKYGKRHVDAALNGRINIGCPGGLVTEIFECVPWTNSEYGKSYKVYLRTAGFDEDKNIITAKRSVYMGFEVAEIVVYINNGKVSYISYL